MKKSRKLVFVLILICLLSGTASFAVEDINTDKNVYIIVLNRYVFDDFQYMPNLNKIIKSGSIGLMNTRGLVGYNGVESYLTINSSNKAMADFNGTEFYNLNERYREIYERRLGSIGVDSNLANIGLNTLMEKNEENNYVPHIGILGDSIHKIGLTTASFGNADIVDYVRRPGSLIPMDSKGLIDYGNVDNILINDKDMPFGFRTDYDKLLEEVNKVKNKASFIVVDTGDLDRLYFYSDQMIDDVYFQKRKDILISIDDFIGELTNNIKKEQSLLMILSPNGNDQRVEESKLSPLILWGSEIEQGILTSFTTKRNGIVTNLDIGPTVAEFLNAPKENMVGNIIYSKKTEDNLDYIQNLNDKVNIISNSRTKILLILAILLIIVMILISILLILDIRVEENLYRTLNFLLVLLGIIPFTFIITSLFNINSYVKLIFIILISVTVLSILINNLKRTNKLLLISSLTYVILIIDLITNGYFSRYSILAPDPVIGARYFGIGNEMVGIFLGSTIIFLGYLLNKTGNKLLTSIMLLFSVILVGHPKLGANVGGSICLLFTVLFFILVLTNKNISIKKIIGIGLAVIVFVSFMSYLDIKFNSTPTHLGKAIMALGGEDDISDNIIIRKILMNIKLVGSSIWFKTLLTSVFVNVMIVMVLGEKIREIFNREKGICIGLLSGIVGSIVGFLFNDSGVLLSSMSMAFITIVFLYILINYEVQN